MTSTEVVISHRQRSRGKLPVGITALDDPETELYPFGHGLGYWHAAAPRGHHTRTRHEVESWWGDHQGRVGEAAMSAR